MVISNTKFIKNSASQNTIQLMYVYNMTISHCTFSANSAQAHSKNIFIGLSNITIDNSDFYDTGYL